MSKATQTQTEADAPLPEQAPAAQVGGIKRKNLIIIGVIALAIWAFAIQTGSTVLMIIVGVLTLVMIGILIWAFRTLRKQRGLVNLLQGATSSPEARRDALSKLSEGKDANAPINVFARAQLFSQVWGQSAGAVRTVDNFVGQLRKRFEANPEQPRHFITVRGSGYRFDP